MYELTQQFPEFSEWYELVKTVSVRFRNRQYRIEVVQRFDRRLQNTYDALLWTGASVDPALPRFEYLLRDATFPWVSQDTPEGALQAALGHLSRQPEE